MKVGTRSARMAVTVVLAVLLVMPTAVAVSYDSPQATVYTIDVDEDGDATWTIELRYQLTSEEDIEAFEGIVRDFEAGNITFFEGIEEEMRPLVKEASNATGREMIISDFERDARVEDTVTRTAGIASVEFRWSDFASKEDGEVTVGDAFVGSGLVIAEDERLVLQHEGRYDIESVVPEPDIDAGERVIWDGEKFFEEGQPTAVLRNGTEQNETTNGEETDEGEDEPNPLSSATNLLAGLLVLMSGFAGGVYLSRKTGTGNGEEISIDKTENEETEIDPQTEDSTELLTDKDRVERLLRDNDGRMKQADIVDETDWSKSKVSMMLSEMEEEDRISKLRLGRENVIDLEDGETDDQKDDR